MIRNKAVNNLASKPVLLRAASGTEAELLFAGRAGVNFASSSEITSKMTLV
jgi:hypothetical protein